MAAVLATAAIVVSGTATAAEQRLSLADRVAKLEASAQSDDQKQATVELLNRIDTLQNEVQSLRGLVEEQSHLIETLKKQGKDQYIDLDSRISRLEGAGAGAPANAASGGEQQPQPLSAEPLEGGTREAGGERYGDRGDERNAPRGGSDFGPGPGGSSPPPVANTPPGPPSAGEKAAYEDAFNLLRNQKYADAARKFNSFLQQFPDSDLAPNAYYWLGESYYVTQNYQVALESFQKLLGKYPESGKAADALLKLGYCQLELRQAQAGERTLNEVVKRYPGSNVANLAQGRLRALRLDGR
jgi:tol-pal system protein YbgF